MSRTSDITITGMGYQGIGHMAYFSLALMAVSGTPMVIGPRLSGLGATAAARHALCVHLDVLAVLVHALITQEHPPVVTEVGCLVGGSGAAFGVVIA
jgi:hypothetical protein